jgi:hypothetical protein
MKVSDLLFLVFSGKCPQTGVLLRDSFSEAFSIARNLACWKKCGAMPLRRKLLKSSSTKIKHKVQVGDGALIAGDEVDSGINQLWKLFGGSKSFSLQTSHGQWFGCFGRKLRRDPPMWLLLNPSQMSKYLPLKKPQLQARCSLQQEEDT